MYMYIARVCTGSLYAYLSFWMQLDVFEVNVAEMTGELAAYESCCGDLTLSALVVGAEHY